MANHNSKSTVQLLAVGETEAGARSIAEAVAKPLGVASPATVVTSVSSALTELRRQPYDAVLALHQLPSIDALALARALRGAGDETPLAIVGQASAIDLEAKAWDSGADEYACLAETTAQQLAGRLSRAIAARERLRESRRLLVAEQQRLQQQRAEAERLVAEQRRLVAELSGEATIEGSATIRLAPAGDHQDAYAAILQRWPGREATEWLTSFAETLAAEHAGAPALLDLHLTEVNRLLGEDPAVEATTRRVADQLLLEAVLHLAEAYRRKYVAAVEPPAMPVSRAA